ncbi:hypothetical protein [Streptomyces fulvorobeus]|uniref:Uncharacterized protein n=1 Tax=Streptomyces fulvorobeus TaxID=284028 RepID=A0A7J0CFH5_9ACTN|nr:hypothetical protein [Streptomyces fulvorobeus]NYE44693.1 hypothetical protein [Streptomyces fulvorobeus]GFN01242.1 hypothetical protein Sfulv_60520 [Streptomyces fulvorobeus]
MEILLAVANVLILLCVLRISGRGRSGGKQAGAALLWLAGLVLMLTSSDPKFLTMGATALLTGFLLLAELVAGRPTCFVSLLWVVAGGALIWLHDDLGIWLTHTNVKVVALAVMGVVSLSLALLVQDERRRDRDPYGGAPGV